MIDFESQVYDKVYQAVYGSYPSISAKSVNDYSPKSFPAMYLEQFDSSTYVGGIDSSRPDSFNEVSYELTIWESGASKKKTAKAIFDVADKALTSLGFIRNSLTPILSTNDTFRLVGRYTAIIDSNGTIYRRQ